MKTTRRQFLHTAGAATVVSLSAPAPRFLLGAAAHAAESSRETVLVVVQLSGGNDGLNTVVPYGDDAYHRNRFTLAQNKSQVRKIDDHLGFHPALEAFDKLLQAGRLGIVQGVGYPDPNRSHFESMDIWHTARASQEARQLGWLGRALDTATDSDTASDTTDIPAIHLGGENRPLALSAAKAQVLSTDTLERLRLKASESARQLAQSLVDARRPENNDLLSFVHSGAQSALTSSRRVEELLKGDPPRANYPSSALADKLRSVAQLIDAGLKTRIYYVTHDGFDTHAQQAAAHAALLGQLGLAVAAFVEDITARGHGERTMVMSFSEFGRRVKENASMGTDHGAAAPMFFAGQKAPAGLVGDHPSLTDLEDGDLKFHTDFRCVYASVLEQWLGFPSAPVLGGKFRPLTLFSA